MDAKKQYVVLCAKHGKESKDWAGKQVIVPMPTTKKQRQNNGCPYCKQEQSIS